MRANHSGERVRPWDERAKFETQIRVRPGRELAPPDKPTERQSFHLSWRHKLGSKLDDKVKIVTPFKINNNESTLAAGLCAQYCVYTVLVSCLPYSHFRGEEVEVQEE